MRTRLYNTETEELGKIINGRYLVDGSPGTLPENMVELEVIVIDPPQHDPRTQIIERREYVDLPNLKFVYEYYSRDLTGAEISEQEQIKKVEYCTPRQLRLALVNLNVDLNSIDSMIEAIQDPVEKQKAKIEWEYSNEIWRFHPLITSFGQQMGFSNDEVDEIFELAVTYK